MVHPGESAVALDVRESDRIPEDEPDQRIAARVSLTCCLSDLKTVGQSGEGFVKHDSQMKKNTTGRPWAFGLMLVASTRI